MGWDMQHAPHIREIQKTKETAQGNGVSGSKKEGKLFASRGTVRFTKKDYLLGD